MMGADKAMQKWRIGILALGVLSLGLLVFVIIQGVSSKTDRQTLKKVTTISDKLNMYVNDKQTVPVSLSEAGINDAPDNVSYTRKSDSSYEFCVTWKAASTDVSSQVTSDLYNATTNQGYSSSNASTYYGYTSNDNAASDLYISSEHKAGKQCQTVTPYFYDSNYGSGNSGSGSDTYNNNYNSNSSDYYTQ